MPKISGLDEEGPGERLTKAELAVVEAAVRLADRRDRFAAIWSAMDWGEGDMGECHHAKGAYVRARGEFRLALIELRQQGES